MAGAASTEVMLAEARAEIAVADHKASMILAATGISFSAFAGSLLANDWQPSDFRDVGEGLWWVGVVAAVLSIGFAGSAVWPRYEASDDGAGIFYWGHVAHSRSLGAFTSRIAAHQPDHDDRTLHQLWHLSRIVRKKYDRVRASMVLAAAAVALFLASGLIGG